MKLRKTLLQVHLILASLFLPYLFLIPLSGAWHLLRLPEPQESSFAFSVTENLPEDEKEKENFFREEFKKHNISFDFEYMKGKGDNYVFRPSTRTHYSAKKEGAEWKVYLEQPSLSKRLMELHKGHGPTFLRWFEAAFGICLLLISLSGFVLALISPAYRKTSVIAIAVGAVVLLYGLLG